MDYQKSAALGNLHITQTYNDANCTHQSSGERLLESMTENMSVMAAVATIKNKPVSPKKSSHKHLLKETLKARFSQPNIDKHMIRTELINYKGHSSWVGF